MKTLFRRLRGIIGNAVFWGIAWFAIAFTIQAIGRFPNSILALQAFLGPSTVAGLFGSMTGAVFSAYIAARFRNNRLEDIGAGQFALGGVLIGLLAALLLQATGFLPQILIPSDLRYVLYGMAVFGTIGGVTALSSIKIARRSLAQSSSSQLLE